MPPPRTSQVINADPATLKSAIRSLTLKVEQISDAAWEISIDLASIDPGVIGTTLDLCD